METPKNVSMGAPGKSLIPQTHAGRVADLCRYLDEAGEPPGLAELASRVGWSPAHTPRVFRQAVGLTPRQHARALRAERVRAALRSGGTVARAFCSACYRSSGRFYEEAPAILGMKPAEYRAVGPRLAIRFALGECSLGTILVAATDQGVCAILLGDDPERLVHDLQQRFAPAELIGAGAGFESTVAHAVGLVEQPSTQHALPLDIRGTAFQQKVWAAMLAIPAGKTCSYAELARAIGRPSAARAVARACAANPLAVAIPCHRVVRKDHGLGGYRWGIGRKRALLARETVDLS